MTESTIDARTDEELVSLFAELSLAQDTALFYDHLAEYNRLYGHLIEISEELKRRVGDRRVVLRKLYVHRNAQVRLNAANNTLAVNLAEARSVLQGISDRAEYPQAGYARSMMDALDDGRYQPT